MSATNPTSAAFDMHGAWIGGEPVLWAADVARWLRDCADKIQENAGEWRAADFPPDELAAEFLRDRAQALDDYRTTAQLDRRLV